MTDTVKGALSGPAIAPPTQDLTTCGCHHNSYADHVIGWDALTGGAASQELREDCMKEEWDELRKAIAKGKVAEIAKECADVVWTVIAYAYGLGIPFDDVWDAVADSNFAKVGPNGETHRRADGKIVKPPGWKKPDIAAILEDRRGR